MGNNIESKIEFMKKLLKERKVFQKRNDDEIDELVREYLEGHPKMTRLEMIIIVDRLATTDLDLDKLF